MIPQQQSEATPSAPERAEQIFTRAGAQLGQWAGQVILRFQHTTQGLRGEAHQPGTPQPSLERAEMVVDRLTQRANFWALKGGSSMKRTAARLREDVEDMLVEVREIQKEWQDKYGHAEGDVR